MSFQGQNAARDLPGLRAAEKLVLIIIGSYADPQNQCFMSQETIANEAGLTVRTVHTMMKKFEAKGLLKRKPRYSRGSRSTDLVTLLFIPERIASTKEGSYRKKGASHTGKTPPLIPERIAEEPSIEPIKEPYAREARERPSASPRALMKERKPRDPAERSKIAAEMRALADKMAAGNSP